MSQNRIHLSFEQSPFPLQHSRRTTEPVAYVEVGRTFDGKPVLIKESVLKENESILARFGADVVDQ